MHDDVSSHPAAVVRGYRIERLIGAGGAAAVYEARRLGRGGLGARVACKVMHAQRAGEADYREQMRQEAVLGLRTATGHPNLVRVLDYFDDAQGPQVRRCIVMELVDGTSVGVLRGPDRRLPAPVVRRIAWDVLEALSYLHGQGVLHRDLSPHNILVTAGGVVKLADFGLAREMEQGKVQTMRFCGTPTYACPEAIQMAECDERADLFTLAAILYELMSGLPPTGKLEYGFSIVARILQGKVAPLPAGTPTDLDDLIIGMLQLDPGARWPQTTAQALELLRSHEQPIASREELGALVVPAQARRQAEIADARPTGALPAGHVLVSRDYVAKPLPGRKVRLRIMDGSVVTRRVLAVAGIVAALAACVAVLGLVLFAQPRDTPDAVDSPQPRQAPAPSVAPQAPVELAPAPPIAPAELAPAPPEPAELAPAPPHERSTPAVMPSPAPPVAPVTPEEPGHATERADGPQRTHVDGKRRALPSGSRGRRWESAPRASEPPHWRLQ